MQRGVQRNATTRVELANRAKDRPRLSLVIVTGLFAFGAGLGAASGLRAALEEGAEPAEPQSESHQVDAGTLAAAELSAVEPTSPDASLAVASRDVVPSADARHPIAAATPAPARALPPAATQAEPEVATTLPEPAPAPEAEPAPIVPLPPLHASAQGRLRHDIIAYTRCDGLREAGGRYPCPRDFALEHEVAAILDRLPACELVQGQHGLAVVRLEYDREGAKPPRASTPSGSEVDPKAVLRCISAPLSRLRTALQPDRMIIRFRFELR